MMPLSVLSISHDKLGPVMKEVRLNLQDGHGLHVLAGWSVESDGQRRLTVRTTEPRTAWSFELGTNLLKISSTSTSAVAYGGTAGDSGPAASSDS